MGGRSQQRSPMQVLVDIEGPGSTFQQDSIDYFCHAQLASQVCIPCTPHHLLCVSAVIFAHTPRFESSFTNTSFSVIFAQTLLFQSSLHKLCFLSHVCTDIVVAKYVVAATSLCTKCLWYHHGSEFSMPANAAFIAFMLEMPNSGGKQVVAVQSDVCPALGFQHFRQIAHRPCASLMVFPVHEVVQSMSHGSQAADDVR